MGNMVVVAVRHDKVDGWESLSVEEAFHALHQFETVTGKCWDQSIAPAMRHGNSYSETSNKGIMMSGYYHASDNVHLLVNNQCMKYLPIWSNDKFEAAQLGKLFRVTRFFNSITKKRTSNAIAPLSTQDATLSFFGILTDNLHRVPNAAIKAMADIVRADPAHQRILAPDGDFDRSDYREVSGYNIAQHHVSYLGTMSPRYSAIFRLFHNSFFCLVMENVDLGIHPEMTETDWYSHLLDANGFSAKQKQK